jgi:hypothetical protein
MEITVPLKLKSSHNIQAINYRGNSDIEIEGQKYEAIENIFDMPGCIVSLENNKANSSIYLKLELDYNLEFDENKVKLKIEEIAELFSFNLSIQDTNPKYGTNYFEIQWFDYKCIPTEKENYLAPHTMKFSDNLTITDSLEMKIIRHYHIKSFPIENWKYDEILHYFYEGLKSNYNKSKFFHWFLILERIENSVEYKSLFNSDKLFIDDEIQQMKMLPVICDDDRKKCIITELKKRTKKSRLDKLFEILDKRNLDIFKIGNPKDNLKLIINLRNKLFHSGNIPDLDRLLYEFLYPLVYQIIEYDLNKLS